MGRVEIYDLQKLSADVGMNFVLDKEKNNVKWTDINILQVKALSENKDTKSIYYKYAYSSEVPYK